MVIWSVRYKYVNMSMINLPIFFKVMIVLYNYPMYYRAPAMLNSTFLNLSATLIFFYFHQYYAYN